MGPPPELAGFCEANKGRLVGLLTLQCGDPHIAEELAQETLVRVCTHWRSVSRMSNPAAWTFRVGINLANSHFRRKAAERRAQQRLQTKSDYRDPDVPETLAVREALATLPKRQRAVLVLRFYADLSVRDVAAALEIPEGTVKTLSHRGLNHLRGFLNTVEQQEVRNAGTIA